MAYRALATPEPLYCGRILVYHVLCKIRKELDPKRSPLRCNQPNSLQLRLDSTFHGNIPQIPQQRGLRIGWVRLNPSGILPSNKLWRTYRETNLFFAVNVTVIGKTICFRKKNYPPPETICLNYCLQIKWPDHFTFFSSAHYSVLFVLCLILIN